MTSFDSRTIRTLALAFVSYMFVRYAVPQEFMSETVKGAVADVIVYLAFAGAAWYRKNARGKIKGWFSKGEST